MTATVTVVGLGPAGAEFLTAAARHALTAIQHRIARTERHPAIGELASFGIRFDALDRFYESASTVEDVYEAIVAEVLDAARTHGNVAYAVPGSPLVAERTVELLRAQREVEVRVIPGLSFVDLACAALGVDPSSVTVIDAHDPGVSAADVSGRVLVAQADSRSALSAVKLVLLEALDPDTPVGVLERLGTEGERVSGVRLAELDREVDPDHLTTLFVDTGTARIGGEFAALVELAARLRAPDGCPWDREQDHHSLARHAIEEAYEVVEAITALPPHAGAIGELGDPYVPSEVDDAFRDELGDLLFQVVLHAQLARERGAFTVADVTQSIHEKLVRRHPHVFGDVEVDDAGDVLRNWEAIKRDEKGAASVFDGIDESLPSLLYAAKVVRKAEPFAVVPERDVPTAADRLATASDEDASRALGELLGAVVLDARARGIDTESALRGWTARLRAEAQRAEAERDATTRRGDAGNVSQP